MPTTPPPPPPPHLPLLISLLFFFLQLLLYPLTSSGVSENSTTIPGCPSINCGGNSPDIKYPFWVEQESSNTSSSSSYYYCGYPLLGLICKNQTPTLRLSDYDYAVKSIDYSTNTLTLANADLLGPNSTCLRPHHNLTLDPYISLNYTSSDTHLFFFFNCSVVGPTEHEIRCFASGDNHSYVFPEEVLPTKENDWRGSCEGIVVEPVLHVAVVESMNGLVARLIEVVQRGFLMGWSQAKIAEECRNCESSGGRCGYNQTTVFACFCEDGWHGDYCGGKGKDKKAIIRVVATGVGGFLLASALGIVMYLCGKRRLRSLSSKLFFRASSESSIKTDPEIGSSRYQTHIFDYSELEEATNNFDPSKELGDGGFGTVYQGKLQDGRIVAVKRLYENNYKRVEQFVNEVEILSLLRHPNLVTLYGCTSRRSRELLLVYEFIPNGTVADHLHGPRASERALTWPIRMNIAIQTADALAYLHTIEPQIIHRDVKTNNILLDSSFHVKVADFGLSRLFPADATHVSTAPQGTPGYLDPEYHQCYQLTDKSDVYSFGVVLVELISSKPAVDISRHRHEINLSNMAIIKIQNCELDQFVDSELGFESDWEIRMMMTMVAELAFRCLQGEREMRPPIKEVLEVLRGIESGGYKVDKAVESDAGVREDTSLLKNTVPFSPDSVTENWESRNTTPNTSK